MSETKDLLRRGGEGFAPREGIMDSLIRRRDRRRRNQRITAGVVGVAVFVGAIWVVTTGPFDQTQTEVFPGGAGTGPAVTGPVVTGPVVTGPAVTGPAVTGPAVTGPAQPTAIGTVTSAGGGCTLEIDAGPIPPGAGRFSVVNETDRPVSFDLFRLTSASVAGIEAFVASGEVYQWPPGQLSRVHPRRTGAFLRVQREVGPGASGTITDYFTTGAFAVVCANPYDSLPLPNPFLWDRDVYRPFAVVGPIVVR